VSDSVVLTMLMTFSDLSYVKYTSLFARWQQQQIKAKTKQT